MTTVAAPVVAFALPIALYCGASYANNGHFRLAGADHGGRVVAAADCATLTLPPAVRPLCPTPAEQAKGPDWLKTSKYSPLAPRRHPGRGEPGQADLRADLGDQEPAAAADRGRDHPRHGTPVRGDPHAQPLGHAPVPLAVPDPLPDLSPLDHARARERHRGRGPARGVRAFHFSNLKPAYGGKAQVNRSVASFLRSYQLNGGFTPGPFLLLCTAAGVIGTLLAIVLQVARPAAPPGHRARPGPGSWPWPACCSRPPPWCCCWPRTWSSSPGDTSCPP